MTTPHPLSVRYNRDAGVGYLIAATALSALGISLWWREGDQPAGLWIPGMVAIAVSFVTRWGLACLLDREPRLVLDEMGLAHRAAGREQVVAIDHRGAATGR